MQALHVLDTRKRSLSNIIIKQIKWEMSVDGTYVRETEFCRSQMSADLQTNDLIKLN